MYIYNPQQALDVVVGLLSDPIWVLLYIYAIWASGLKRLHWTVVWLVSLLRIRFS
jgi:hypothetical protein